MECSLVDHPRDQSNYSEENYRENYRKRPESPGPPSSFSNVLYGVAQCESRGNGAARSEKEGGHKSVELTRSPASVLVAVETRPQDRKDVNDRNEVHNSEDYSA
jgi:hypothetical protein